MSRRFPRALLAAAAAVTLAAVATPAAATPVSPLAAVDTGTPLFDLESLDPALRAGDERVDPRTVRYSAPRTVITEPGASYIKVHFAAFALVPGDTLTVSNPAGTETHTYSVDPTAADRPAGDASFTTHRTRGFAAMSVDGDTAVVTLHAQSRLSAAALDRAGYGVRIDRHWRGYTAAEQADRAEAFSVCGKDARQDAACYVTSHPTEYARRGPVARLVMGGGGRCTTWRVGETNRMMTNNHCISRANAVASSEVQFGYECATCAGNNPATPTKVGGGEFLKTGGSGRALDYTLYTVKDFDRIKQFGTLYLDPAAPKLGGEIYIIGHGNGKPKQYSIFEEPGAPKRCTSRAATAERLPYMCDTTPGSSGSPVLSADSHKVIAIHNLGGCANSGVRMELIYPQIASMIDNDPPAAG